MDNLVWVAKSARGSTSACGRTRPAIPVSETFYLIDKVNDAPCSTQSDAHGAKPISAVLMMLRRLGAEACPTSPGSGSRSR
jgi:hypothetical protein